MKRRELIAHLLAEGCLLRREGKHAIYANPDTGHIAAVPRHSEIDTHLARKICRQLGVKAVEAK